MYTQDTATIDDNTCGPLFNKVADCLCQTEMREITFSFMWQIRNVSLLKPGDFLGSLNYCLRTDEEVDKTVFCLRLIRHGHVEGPLKLDIALILVSRHKLYSPIKSKISVINKRGEEVKTSAYSIDGLQNTELGQLVQKYGFSVDPKSLMAEDPPVEKLTFYCEVTFLAKLVTETLDMQKEDYNQIMKDHDDLSDFRLLLENPGLSDVTLVAEEKEFFAHKVILAARSPVFAAMFTHEMEEKTQNRVDIEDIRQEVLEEMLRFIYTGKTLKVETMTADLLAAADKYALKGLVRLCGDALFRNMTLETSLEILVLADMHKLDRLKQKAIDLINNHSDKVRNTREWTVMTQNHPHLIIESFLFRPSGRPSVS